MSLIQYRVQVSYFGSSFEVRNGGGALVIALVSVGYVRNNSHNQVFKCLRRRHVLTL